MTKYNVVMISDSMNVCTTVPNCTRMPTSR